MKLRIEREDGSIGTIDLSNPVQIEEGPDLGFIHE
jgi:hypothetical protein